MASPQEFLALSSAVYQGPGGGAPAGWTKIKESPVTPGNDGSSNGYFGAAFQNDGTGEIVVANRGSRGSLEGLKQDWGGSDIKIARQDNKGVPPAFEDATAFAQSVQADNPGRPIRYTGHSLGGAEAQVQAANAGGSAVTFGAPGARFAVSDSRVAAAESSVVNYALPGDLVAARGEHIGQRSMIFPSARGAIKDTFALALGAIVGGPLGLLVALIGAVASNHPLSNYGAALGSPSSMGAGAGGKPAARLTDMHVCPMVTGIVPHVGGPIAAPCAPTVFIGGLPAARVTDTLTCVGPPDKIILGSTTVYVRGQPSARIGDITAHGGQIVMGMPTVLVNG